MRRQLGVVGEPRGAGVGFQRRQLVVGRRRLICGQLHRCGGAQGVQISEFGFLAAQAAPVVSAGQAHTCMVDDGVVSCWGGIPAKGEPPRTLTPTPHP